MAYHPGPAYMRTSAAEDAGHLRSPTRSFAVGGLKVLRESANDAATIIGAGITVFEALKAYDQLQKIGISDPRDRSLFAAADRLALAAAMRARHQADHHRRGSLRRGRHRRCGGRLRERERVHGRAALHPRAFRAAARPSSSSITTAFRHAISLRRWPHEKSQRLPENRRHRRRNGYRGRGRCRINRRRANAGREAGARVHAGFPRLHLSHRARSGVHRSGGRSAHPCRRLDARRHRLRRRDLHRSPACRRMGQRRSHVPCRARGTKAWRRRATSRR